MEHKFLRISETFRIDLSSVVAYAITVRRGVPNPVLSIHFAGSSNSPIEIDYNEEVYNYLDEYFGCVKQIDVKDPDSEEN